MTSWISGNPTSTATSNVRLIIATCSSRVYLDHLPDPSKEAGRRGTIQGYRSSSGSAQPRRTREVVSPLGQLTQETHQRNTCGTKLFGARAEYGIGPQPAKSPGSVASAMGAVLDLHATRRRGRDQPAGKYQIWTGNLRGDGWQATWRGDRSLFGPVTLTGRLCHWHQLADNPDNVVRGRVRRIQVVSIPYHAPTGDRWEPMVDWPRLYRDVEMAAKSVYSSISNSMCLPEIERHLHREIYSRCFSAWSLTPRLTQGTLSASYFAAQRIRHEGRYATLKQSVESVSGLPACPYVGEHDT
jgi:hypothetical protein